MNTDTAIELRLVGIDPDRLVERRRRPSVVVDIAARRRELLDRAAADYVLADRHVHSRDEWVDDQLERSHVRLQHDHPTFFARNQPIPEVTR